MGEVDWHSEELYQEIDWNSLRYAVSKLGEVIYVLVTGCGDVRSRLREGAQYFDVLNPHGFPEYAQLRERFEKVRSRLTKYPTTYYKNVPYIQYSIDGTLERIRNKTASKIAGDLYAIYLDIVELEDEHFREGSS